AEGPRREFAFSYAPTARRERPVRRLEYPPESDLLQCRRDHRVVAADARGGNGPFVLEDAKGDPTQDVEVGRDGEHCGLHAERSEGRDLMVRTLLEQSQLDVGQLDADRRLSGGARREREA